MHSLKGENNNMWQLFMTPNLAGMFLEWYNIKYVLIVSIINPK
jgi:hypothetical protein